MNELDALHSLGIELPSPAYIVGVIVFSIVGMVAWYVGRKRERPRTKWLGVALCFYPYVVWSTWMIYVVGIALCVGVWLDRG